MMALGDILAARADNARARGTVEAGTLGTVTVEALPVRELERLMRGADSDRAVFYAACRELQGAGAALLRAGKVYRPDQVMALVSDAEAAKAAEAVRALSGWTETETNGKVAEVSPAENTDGDSAGAGKAADTGAEQLDRDTDKAAPVGAASPAEAEGTETDKRTLGQVSRETEVRPEGVQMAEKVRPDAVQENAEVRHSAVQENGGADEVRPDTVRKNVTAFEEIRQDFVQNKRAGGQASCEFLAEYGEPLPPDGKTQVLPKKSPNAPQNVGISDKMDGSLQKTEREFLSERAAPERGYALGLHESKSEIDGRGGANLHESESENGAGSGKALHESTSEYAETLHENKSENDATGGNPLHESKSEVTETLHETTSELAERVARELLDGLRRAAWVR